MVAWLDVNNDDTIEYYETVRSVSVWVPLTLDSLTVTANFAPVEPRPPIRMGPATHLDIYTASTLQVSAAFGVDDGVASLMRGAWT